MNNEPSEADIKDYVQFERPAELRQARRDRRDEKAFERLSKLEDKAEARVGILVRDGAEVCYIFPPGGAYREGDRSDLIAFLIRNHYV